MSNDAHHLPSCYWISELQRNIVQNQLIRFCLFYFLKRTNHLTYLITEVKGNNTLNFGDEECVQNSKLAGLAESFIFLFFFIMLQDEIIYFQAPFTDSICICFASQFPYGSPLRNFILYI